VKTYEVTYSIINNDEISKEFFHDKWLQPLYVKLTYQRKSTKYRSRLFDLFQKPKYGLHVAKDVIAPDIEAIIKREESLVEFIINKHSDNFSFKAFKEDYDFYSRDVLTLMEIDFISFLRTHLDDVGMPFLSEALTDESVCEKLSIYEVVQDLKLAFKPDHYEDIVESSVQYANPYFPVSKFLENAMRHPYALTLVDTENPKFIKDLNAYIKKNYKEHSQSLMDSLSDYISKAQK